MNKIEQLEWKAEKHYLGRAFTAVLANGTVLKVLDVEPSHADAVGYTSRNKTIHLAYSHEIMKDLSKPYRRVFRQGVGVHETMHQIKTDFILLEKNIAGLPSYEQQIFAQLHNIVEDARIEHFAKYYVGGSLLSSLEFAIAHTYQITEPLEKSPNALTQFMSALIMYGDMGPLKGRFTFPESKEAFMKSVDLMDKAIHEGSCRKAIKLVKEIFEISRPLWQNEVDMAKLMESLMKEMAKSGKSLSSGSGKPSAGSGDEEDGDEGEDKKSKMRKVTRKEFEEAIKNGAKAGKGGKGSETLVCEETLTAEEAKEAAEDARVNANDARTSANEAKKAAEEAANNGSSPARTANAQKAANRAEAAAQKAEQAANNAEAAAKASAEAKANGDEAGEQSNAKTAGRESIKAANAAMNAAKAAANAAGENSEGSTSEDADGASESAAQAQAAADEAAENAEKAESGEGTGTGEGISGKSKAEKAKEAAEKAAEAAKEAQEAAEAAKEHAENGDAEAEASAARAAARAAAKAKAAARAAERAAREANGEPVEEAGEAEDATTDPYNDYQGSNTDSDYSERCLNGSTPDYHGASVGESEEDDGEETTFDMEDYEISEADLAAIEKEIESCLREVERAEKEGVEENSTPLPDFDIAISRVKKAATCLNVRVKPGDDIARLNDNYARILNKLKPGIDTLTGQLKRIFQDDIEERDYRYSGKINTKRVNSGRKTARVFDRRRLPAEKADLIVELLVDESGSMSGSKAEHAKQAAIALAEVMSNLKIPVYVIGFTADTSGYDAVHNHYITWKNSKMDRLKLLNITARCDNFDGYSIRYGGEILKKKNAKHKLMIVISDGSPACYSYRGADGIPDTKDAIRDVRKDASVLGIAIGNSDTEELHYMYGKDFIHIRNMDDLFAGMSKKMAQIIRSWE